MAGGTYLWGRGPGQCVRGLLGVDGVSLLLLSDWLLCTCLSTLLFRSSKAVMAISQRLYECVCVCVCVYTLLRLKCTILFIVD